MIKVAQLLANKDGCVWQVAPEDSIHRAMALMEERGIGAVVVVHEGMLAGIVSERDCARQVIVTGRCARTTPVREIMTRQVFYTSPDEDVEHCLATMSRHHIRHLPVLAQGGDRKRVVGVITMGDVVKTILDQQRDRIEHLERYISWAESF